MDLRAAGEVARAGEGLSRPPSARELVCLARPVMGLTEAAGETGRHNRVVGGHGARVF